MRDIGKNPYKIKEKASSSTKSLDLSRPKHCSSHELDHQKEQRLPKTDSEKGRKRSISSSKKAGGLSSARNPSRREGQREQEKWLPRTYSDQVQSNSRQQYRRSLQHYSSTSNVGKRSFNAGQKNVKFLRGGGDDDSSSQQQSEKQQSDVDAATNLFHALDLRMQNYHDQGLISTQRAAAVNGANYRIWQRSVDGSGQQSEPSKSLSSEPTFKDWLSK